MLDWYSGNNQGTVDCPLLEINVLSFETEKPSLFLIFLSPHNRIFSNHVNSLRA